ncbi:MAG TPA: hypothetical protein VIU46_01415 [Gallionellaceae bacterium]
MSYKDTHWRILVAFARLFGVMGILAGTVFALSVFYYWTTPEVARKVSTFSGSAVVDSALAAMFCYALGVSFLFVKADMPGFLKDENS